MVGNIQIFARYTSPLNFKTKKDRIRQTTILRINHFLLFLQHVIILVCLPLLISVCKYDRKLIFVNG